MSIMIALSHRLPRPRTDVWPTVAVSNDDACWPPSGMAPDWEVGRLMTKLSHLAAGRKQPGVLTRVAALFARRAFLTSSLFDRGGDRTP